MKTILHMGHLSLRLVLLLILMCPLIGRSQDPFEKIYPSTLDQSGIDILPTSDGGYLIAGMTLTRTLGDTDLYLLKINNSGDTMWAKQYGGAQPDFIQRMILANDGNYLLAGFTLSYGSGSYDVWLIKIDPSGNLLWSKTYGSSNDESAHDLIATSDGNYMITGQSNHDALLLKVDPTGNTLWTKTYGGTQYETSHSVKECGDGGFIFVGQTFSYGQGLGDVWLVKTDPNGTLSWSKTFGGSQADEGQYILANSDGSFTIDAETNSFGAGNIDIYVINTDASGNLVWSNTHGGASKDVTHIMQATSDGGYIIGGISRSFGWSNPDMWIVKINSTGSTTWTQHYGGAQHEHCYSIKQTGDGGYIAVGHSDSYSPHTEIMVVKMNAVGTLSIVERSKTPTFEAYPNPTTGKLCLGFADNASSHLVTIHDMLGQVIFQQELSSAVRDKTIDLSDQMPGVYFLNINCNGVVSTKKIILQ